MKLLLALLAFLLTIAGCRDVPPQEKVELIVACAASVDPFVQDAAADFEKTHTVSVVVSAGSTGMLAKQLRDGAPFDLFVAADMKFPKELEEEKRLENVREFARGSLAIAFASPELAAPSVEAFLATPPKRIAIANPEVAPYGAAARDSLRTMGAWEALGGELVIAGDIRQTLQYVETGNVDAAFVAKSLVMGSKLPILDVPGALHPPIAQGLGVVRGRPNREVAAAFAEFLRSAGERHARFGLRAPE